MLIPTATTRLRGVPRVYPLDTDASLLPFIGDEGIQLGKRPAMESSFVLNVLMLFATSHLGGLSNVTQVFQDNRAARGCLLDNPFGENVVTVPVEAQSLPCQLFQVAFGTFCSLGLQFSLEAEIAAVNLFPTRRPKKLTVAGDSRVIESQVNTDHLIGCGDMRLRNRYHDM
jgi:hypothetical protein